MVIKNCQQDSDTLLVKNLRSFELRGMAVTSYMVSGCGKLLSFRQSTCLYSLSNVGPC